jgi:uncharacterized membrane protein
MMPTVELTERIHASAEAVFDLIARAEDYPRYCRSIREVRPTGPDTYRWTVNLAGLGLEWDAVVTERNRPLRFAWQSTRGVANRGEFRLARLGDTTEIRFIMEYRLPGLMPQTLAGLLASPFAQHIAAELLAEVRRRLEPAPG